TGFLGALSLDGSLQAVEGMLPAVLAAKKSGLNKLYFRLMKIFLTLHLKTSTSFTLPPYKR
ncbi:MAG: hypothetical protein Q8906_14680, partial [Bacillota bacterium]|nr:hypothetical protein [Bacillota bacterium]